MRAAARAAAGLSLLWSGCGGSEPPPEPAPKAPAHHDRGRFVFVEATERSGLGGFLQVNGDPEKPFLVETVGGGVALLDYDADGDLDAYLSNGGRLGETVGPNTPSDALYRNDGSGLFEDVSTETGIDERRWSNGALVTDLNGDDRPDVYVTNYGPNTLWLNVEGRSFDEASERSGLADPGWSTGAAFLDHDRDGDLDVYVANYVKFDEHRLLKERPTIEVQGLQVMKGPRGLPTAQDRFYVNSGSGGFEDATAAVGIEGAKAFGFQCLAFDADQDGWIDVYVANDSVGNYLWRNLEGQGFEDRAVLSGVALSTSGQPQAGMGVGIGDYDGDLEPDLFVTNFSDDYFTVYRGRGGGYFLDSTLKLELSQATKAMLGWGCGFVDFDSDGRQELFAVNGHVYPQIEQLGDQSYAQRNQLFEYVDGKFREPEGLGGSGFALRASSRGAAVGDLDGDGDLDLLVGNIDGPPTLLENRSTQGAWVKVVLQDRGPLPWAPGARLIGKVGERRLLSLVGTGSSFLSSWDRRAHFGLGTASQLDELLVRWPDGTEERLGPLASGATWRLERQQEGASRAVRVEP